MLSLGRRWNDRLVAFGRDGQLLWTAGRHGEGPGEFSYMGDAVWGGNGVFYVSHGNGSRVDAWTATGERLHTQSMVDLDVSQAYVAGAASDGILVLKSFSRTQGDGAVVNVLHVADPWTRRADFFAAGGREPDQDEPTLWAFPTVRVFQDQIWVGNRLDYAIRQYSLDGELQRVISREHPSLIPMLLDKGNGFYLGEFAPPLWSDAGYGLISRAWTVGIKDVEQLKRIWDEYLAAGGRGPDPIEFAGALDLVEYRKLLFGLEGWEAPGDGWPRQKPTPRRSMAA